MNWAHFLRIGRRYLDNPPQSSEALNRLSALPAGHGDYLLLHAAAEADNSVYLLSIRHHRQLMFDFSARWPR